MRRLIGSFVVRMNQFVIGAVHKKQWAHWRLYSPESPALECDVHVSLSPRTWPIPSDGHLRGVT